MLRMGEMVTVLARVASSASAAEEEDRENDRLQKEEEEKRREGEEIDWSAYSAYYYEEEQWSNDLSEAAREHHQLLYGDDENRRSSNDELRNTLASWFHRHREPMQLVVAARNAVLRQEPIDDTKLAEAVDLAEGLLQKWAGWRDGAFNQPATH